MSNVREVKERPILFSAPMVQAILEGRKTQTRRPIKKDSEAYAWLESAGFDPEFVAHPENASLCPFGKPGDRLWVRESARLIEWRGFRQCRLRYEADGIETDWMDFPGRLKGNERLLKGRLLSNGVFKEARRIVLEITQVRVERLQEISDVDARAEGYGVAFGPGMYSRAFDSYWDTLAKDGFRWSDNPWVWVIEFKAVTK